MFTNFQIALMTVIGSSMIYTSKYAFKENNILIRFFIFLFRMFCYLMITNTIVFVFRYDMNPYYFAYAYFSGPLSYLIARFILESKKIKREMEKEEKEKQTTALQYF